MIYRHFCLLVFASLLPGLALAQSTTATEEEIIPQYDVEIIIFKNLTVPKGREFVLPVSSPARSEPMFDISSQASVAAAAETGYQLLGADEFRLLEVVARLIESPRYELLLHAAWRQPGLEREKAMPIWIKGGRIYGSEYTSIDNRIEIFDNRGVDSEGKSFAFDEQTLESQELQLLEQQQKPGHKGLYELEGKITVALARYLHTYTDLVLRRPRLSDAIQDNAAQAAYVQANLADTRILNNHLLREHRRMRSKNLHYLDSPEFALLILITPYEVAEGFEEAEIEPEIENEATAVQ